VKLLSSSFSPFSPMFVPSVKPKMCSVEALRPACLLAVAKARQQGQDGSQRSARTARKNDRLVRLDRSCRFWNTL
jgi:hypothetical protein